MCTRSASLTLGKLKCNSMYLSLAKGAQIKIMICILACVIYIVQL